jgi:hypothetical protein
MNSLVTSDGYSCDLPAGKYYIGDPKQMLTPEAYKTIGAVKEGVIYDPTNNSYIFICEFGHTDFGVEFHGQYWVNFYSPNSFVAIMSENIVHDKNEELFFETSLPLRVSSYVTKILMYNAEINVTIYEPIEIDPEDYETSDQERDRLSGGYYSRPLRQ